MFKVSGTGVDHIKIVDHPFKHKGHALRYAGKLLKQKYNNIILQHNGKTILTWINGRLQR